MGNAFWEQRWDQDQLGWHRDVVNASLERYLPRMLDGNPGTVLFPLCGKSLDLAFVAGQGRDVVGVELVEKAVVGFFAGQGEEPARNTKGPLARFTAGRISILQGDFFAATAAQVGAVSAVFDRGAMIALPADVRARYVPHLLGLLSPGTRILLLTVSYDQDRVDGPPFSVTDDEVEAAYGALAELEVLERDERGGTPGRFADAGVEALREAVWLITLR